MKYADYFTTSILKRSRTPRTTIFAWPYGGYKPIYWFILTAFGKVTRIRGKKINQMTLILLFYCLVVTFINSR